MSRSSINGRSSEYSTIEGVQEDVVDILLNLKGVVFKLHNCDDATLKLAKEADRAAAFFEAVALAGFTRREAERIFGRPAISPQALADEIAPAAVDVIQARFLARFHTIDGARG